MSDDTQETRAQSGPSSRALIVLWTLGVGGIFLFTLIQVATSMYENRRDSQKRHAERMDPSVLESGLDPKDAELPPNARPVKVTVGVYVDRIIELSVKETGWRVEFYVWFRWTGLDFDPGELFDVIDGRVEERQKQDEYVDGEDHYQRYRAVAHITKFFDVTRFPVEEHMMTINIEIGSYRRDALLLVPDDDSAISSRAKVPAFKVVRTAVVEKPHMYRSDLGDPRMAGGKRAIYSQYRFGIVIQRDGWGFFFKLFQGLFASLAVAMAAFFIKPTDVDPRFGLGVGAFFASIANSYVTSSLIPDTGVMTLADIINGLAMATIFLTMVQSVISLYLYDIREQEELSRKFDKWSFWTFAVAIVVINVAMPFAAKS